MSTINITTEQLNNNQPIDSWAKAGEFNYVNVDNLSLRYLTMGQGEPLVLIHTIRSQLDYFQKIIPQLAKHYQVIALDLPGHGKSQISHQVHNKPLFVSAVTGLIKKLNLNNVTLVGESIGAAIALGIAAEKKVTVKQVFALNSADYNNSNGLDRSSILGKILFTGIRLPIIGFIISNAERSQVLKKVFEGGFVDNTQLPESLIAEFSQSGNRKGFAKAFRSIFLNWTSWVEGVKQYQNIDVPVELIYSDHDWSLPQERLDNQKRIKHAQLKTIDQCGHFSALEKPNDILKIILADKKFN
ncbi:MAG: alpha/beta hydrolase [Saccharospirillaceae bacterium]|nr:alpha/beta hydrolase [Pseudomonadales bacterium]NRB80523.1 alpha/beta hydrolase [Saccharospirillaceae bacterium]